MLELDRKKFECEYEKTIYIGNVNVGMTSMVAGAGIAITVMQFVSINGSKMMTLLFMILFICMITIFLFSYFLKIKRQSEKNLDALDEDINKLYDKLLK